MIPLTHDGTADAPKLKIYLNLGTLTELPAWSTWPKLRGSEAIAFIKESGFEGIQDGDAALARAAGIGTAGSGRVNLPAEAEPLAKRLKDAGHDAATLHVGWGFESDAEIDALADAILNASAKTGLPLYIETHRATMIQDAWRAVQLTRRRPGIKFNIDLSHYYTGLELIYGELSNKLPHLQPVLDRTGFMHGRIGSPGNMQVDIGDGNGRPKHAVGAADFLADYKQMWTLTMASFLKAAKPGDYLVFAPEILHSTIYYARMFPGPDGALREESDRWQQALVYARIARECFNAAKGHA